MISIEKQQDLFIAISKELKKKIVVYAIGGTAMMFFGLKEATLDIDLVFENEKDRKEFKKAVQNIGYKEFNPAFVYGERINKPEMLKLDDSRLDLFIDKIIHFIFSKNMKERAKTIHQFGDNLIIKIADPHDLIMMKCATDRIKDKDDVKSILLNKTIDFDIIIKEAENQVKLGQKRAVFDLGCFLEDLKKIMNEKIPQEVLNKLFKIVKKQAEQKVEDI